MQVNLCVSLLALAVAGGPGREPAGSTSLLQIPLGLLSSPEAAALSKGGVVARVLDSVDRSEVLTLSAVRVRAAPASFRACARAPSCLFGHEDFLGAGRIGRTVDANDLDGLDLDPGDREHLERCRVGRCGVRLPADAIARFQQEVDWREADASGRALTLFRNTLAELALRYASEGDPGLPTYEDRERRTSVAQVRALLLARPLPLFDLSAQMRQDLQASKGTALLGDADYLCWRKERFWRQSLITLEHVALHDTREGALMATAKQVYASHYFDASVAFFAFIPDPVGEGALLVHVGRAQADIRPSGFTWWERTLLNRMVRGRLRRHLRTLRDRLQAAP